MIQATELEVRAGARLLLEPTTFRVNPGDKIGTDGVYGPQTEARIRKSPRTGFSRGASCK